MTPQFADPMDPPGGKCSARPKFVPMPRDLASILRLKATRAQGPENTCSGCRRVPLAGELLHELSSHRRVCQLCLSLLPESKRETISTQRMHVSDRPLLVARRAA
jgi:hypothetical protein